MENNEVNVKLLFIITMFIFFTFVFGIIFNILKTGKHRASMNEAVSNNSIIYCPDTYKLIKGDGGFTSVDTLETKSYKKVNIVSSKNDLLYTEDEKAFNLFDCHIKE